MTEHETASAEVQKKTDEVSQLTKMAVELGPLLVFFAANARAGIFWGTGIFIIATVISLVASRLLFGRIPVMPLISGCFVVVFGTLTLWLQNDLFIKLKPTIVNLTFAIALFGGLLAKKSLLRYIFGEVFHLTDEGWRRLTMRWAVFFVFLAILNELAWRYFSTDAWVSFKVFGVMPLTMVFAISQVGLLKRHELKS